MNWTAKNLYPVREIKSNLYDCRVRIYVLEAGIIRVRYVTGNLFDEWPSYGVSCDFSPDLCDFVEEETEEAHIISTPIVRVVVNKDDLTLEFIQIETGEVLSSDARKFDYLYNDWTGDYRVSVGKHIKEKEYFYGLGDKPADLNLRSKRFEMWGADHYAFKENADPLYKNITFFVSLCGKLSYGLFFDNTCRSFFDFGATEDDVLSFGAEGGQMDYYFIHSSSPLSVIADYTRLTGLPPMPPLWALGYHQSKWSYYPADAVEQVCGDMRRHKMPCDSIHLDIHHMDDYRSLTWDPVWFPDPVGMINRLKNNGIKPVVIVNPGVKIDKTNDIWRSGYQSNCYCRRHDGAVMEGVVWPGFCHFPDFTAPFVRDWWSDIMGAALTETGVSGIWNDMNEPVVFPDRTFPLDTRHNYDGRSCSHSKAHNIYGHCMAYASYEAMLKYGREKRPFNLSRSGYAGMQRFAATWTGDNCSTWEHIKLANFQCQRLATSGVSFAGSDVGGFLEHPSPELFCRWMQMGAFHLFFRNHSSGEFGGQEPWMFGEEVEGYVRFALEERYKLLPYFYTQSYIYATKGVPIIRSLALQFSELEDTHWRGVEFFVGDHLYVVPILHDEARGVTFFVPPGQWYSLWDDSPAGESGTDSWSEAPLSRIPVFVRGGAVITRWPVQQYAGELACPDLFLDLWWAEQTTCHSCLYEDGGEGFDYRNGVYAYHEFAYSSSERTFELTHQTEGEGSGFHDKMILRLHAIPHGVERVRVSIEGQELKEYPVTCGRVEIELPEHFETLMVSFC